MTHIQILEYNDVQMAAFDAKRIGFEIRGFLLEYPWPICMNLHKSNNHSYINP